MEESHPSIYLSVLLTTSDKRAETRWSQTEIQPSVWYITTDCISSSSSKSCFSLISTPNRHGHTTEPSPTLTTTILWFRFGPEKPRPGILAGLYFVNSNAVCVQWSGYSAPHCCLRERQSDLCTVKRVKCGQCIIQLHNGTTTDHWLCWLFWWRKHLRRTS